MFHGFYPELIMTALFPALSAPAAWEPLPQGEWNAEAARHLLRRAGWTALPADVDRATREGLAATLDRLFPAAPILFPEPALSADFADAMTDYQAKILAAAPEERRLMQREFQERSRSALLDMSIHWMQFAVQPGNAAFEKWVLFLSDVYVVSYEKVNRTPLIYRHFDTLARNALGPAPVLTKAVSRSPAMINYLDLNQSRRGAPNENFARELFELFVLGEGNYTEKDIKESARAFTGYRLRPPAEFFFAPLQHDNGPKTVFGHTGNLSGDDVIDLAYGTKAAGAFLPHEMVKFYLSDAMLPPEHLSALGERWQTQGYDLRWLAQTFFGSRLFFAPEFRGNFIKSPIQFYLGLVQDLDLSVAPIPRYVVNPLRQMGQVLFTPPNVRGWVGGRNWINSASLAARRTMVETLFNPINEKSLNADELVDVAAARSKGLADFAVGNDRLAPLLALDPDTAALRLVADLLPVNPPPAFRESLEEYIGEGNASETERLRRIKRATVTLLESPEYQLC